MCLSVSLIISKYLPHLAAPPRNFLVATTSLHFLKRTTQSIALRARPSAAPPCSFHFATQRCALDDLWAINYRITQKKKYINKLSSQRDASQQYIYTYCEKINNNNNNYMQL